MWRRIGLVWLLLLVISNGWRLAHPPATRPAGDQRTLELPERDSQALTGDAIAVAWRDYNSATPTAATPVLLLHGTPVAATAIDGLARLLAATHRVVAPDLPGFGRSQQPLADYSSLTHGHYMADLLRRLDIERAHVVAYSQGGAAAIELAARYPDRVQSLTLLSAIGVQELELFGSYRMNHAVYRGQLWLLRAAQWLLPHFGYLDNAILGPGYARNLTDTDQRPLRERLREIEAPTLIVHGNADGLVPVAAAREHYRLVPHSTLQIVAGGHELAYAQPRAVAPAIRDFLARTDNGLAPSRADAAPARVDAAAAAFVPMPRQALTGAALIVLLLAIVAATYVSEDLTCIAAGLLVAQGLVSFPLAVGACLIGLLSGDIGLFLAGRWLGPAALRRVVAPARLAEAKAWLAERGPWVIVISRFTPGTRLPTYVAAGALRMPLGRFVGYFALATALWTPLLVGLAMLYGEAVNTWFERYATLGVIVLALGIAIIWAFLRLALPATTHRGRRLLLSRWRRLTRFEFWPRWAFYPPIVMYCLWLSLRYRSLTAFTLANPGMPLGGLVGESKSAILAALEPSGCVAPFALLTGAGDRMRQLERLLADGRFAYPIVLKPDSGERGRAVAIVHTTAAARDYLAAHAGPVIAQQYVTGSEYGVFYVRLPDAPHGQIFSLTHKGTTTVEGDGERTLHDLILDDARAVCMAPFFMQLHAARLRDVPARGERVALNRIGTHSRGSLFTDAGAEITAALTAEIERISRHFDGFYFGRYDIIVDDAAALAEGSNLTVIELNGVTSEATHIYHPGYSVWYGWRTIARQWHFAWRIGAQLKARGQRPATLKQIIAALRGSRAGRPLPLAADSRGTGA